MLWRRLNIGSRVNREVHARFWERAEAKFLRATRQKLPRRSQNDVSALPPKAPRMLLNGAAATAASERVTWAGRALVLAEKAATLIVLDDSGWVSEAGGKLARSYCAAFGTRPILDSMRDIFACSKCHSIYEITRLHEQPVVLPRCQVCFAEFPPSELGDWLAYERAEPEWTVGEWLTGKTIDER